MRPCLNKIYSKDIKYMLWTARKISYRINGVGRGNRRKISGDPWIKMHILNNDDYVCFYPKICTYPVRRAKHTSILHRENNQ